MSGPLSSLVRREIAIARRIGGGGSMGVVFLLVLVTIVPFAIGPDLNLLRRIGPAILWIASLLAMLLGLDRLFQADWEDGSLDQLQLGATPLEAVVFVKCLAHWATTALPLVVAAPLMGLLMAQEPESMLGIGVSLLVGSPAMTFIGAVGAAATVSLRRGGLLMALLVLPLCIPALIFGVSAANAAAGGTVPFLTPLAVLAALTLASGALCPFAAAALLRRLGE
ncbi:MAG: heme exporter protein CcmB [Hyphomicrobiales bacterium]|nr:heme exporter protein CcmB [Hyphomicrobiales bacterium]